MWWTHGTGEEGAEQVLRGQILFIDTRKMGRLMDRVHRKLTEEDITKIAGTYHAWRGDKGAGVYDDIPGFCKSAAMEEICQHGFVLTPGRYVGVEAAAEDEEPFPEKMRRLTLKLEEQFAEGARLEAAIRKNLRNTGYGS